MRTEMSLQCCSDLDICNHLHPCGICGIMNIWKGIWGAWVKGPCPVKYHIVVVIFLLAGELSGTQTQCWWNGRAPKHGAASGNPAGHSSGRSTGSAASPLISCSSQGSRGALPITAGSRAAQETPGDPHPPGGSPVPRLDGQDLHDLFGFLISILPMMENAALVQSSPTQKPKAL